MGYFANGTEGEMYEARYCARCVHQGDETRVCPVLELHLLYNYDQIKKASTREALRMFISEVDGGNAQCVLFWERGRGNGGGEPVPIPFQIVRAA